VKHLLLLTSAWLISFVLVSLNEPRHTGEFAIIGMFVLTTATIINMVLERRDKRKGQNAPPPASIDSTEQRDILEAMSLEIERIGEGQRFLTKLFAEREEALRQLPKVSAPSQHNTPH
jgi:hypothetical protein